MLFLINILICEKKSAKSAQKVLILKFGRFDHLSNYVDTTGLWGLKVRFVPRRSEGLSFGDKKNILITKTTNLSSVRC